MKTKSKNKPPRPDYPESTRRLGEIVEKMDVLSSRLDVIINLLLDVIPEERFGRPREFTPKLKHLDSTRWILLRPADAGRIFGRPSKDISSRRKEIATAKRRKPKKSSRTPGNQKKTLQSIKDQ